MPALNLSTLLLLEKGGGIFSPFLRIVCTEKKNPLDHNLRHPCKLLYYSSRYKVKKHPISTKGKGGHDPVSQSPVRPG